MIIWGRKPSRGLHSDLADTCLFLMDQYESEDIINVGWGTDLTIKELAMLIAEVVGFEGKWNGILQSLMGHRKVLD